SLEDIIDGLKELLEQIAPGTKPEDIVITDIFHIDVSDEYTKYFEEGGKLEVTITTPNDIIAALKEQGDIWKDLGDNFIDNGDGTYTLLVDGDMVIALIKNASKVDVDPDNPEHSSPTTGDMTWVYVVSGLVLAGAAVVLFAVAKKQKA
ncbi:MAG: LPXTG cell wall anchor domain-containing protein, partial [Clostridia bacterium]|nr:LPXTG cell wall anchor domain-containing protein [Clostridia bacterium]